jgi:uncharacterized Zn finger protein (UPF0148 family)
MPTATPIPRGPSVLTLYSASDLLTAPGCPVCRYAAEARDRYLGWFALEGHAQPGLLATLGGSLGMCAAHSRRLMGQPGAAVRLTVVYRYVVTAARERLAGGVASVAPCPACEHDNAAAGRALETLVDGLDDSSAAERCRDLGGVCIPHLAAASGRAHRRVVAWLGETMRESLAGAGPGPIGWLAGTDQDTQARAVLRASIPAAGIQAPTACGPCLAAMAAEGDSLARLPIRARGSSDDQAAPALCAGHLADAAALAAAAGGLRDLLTGQAAATIARTRLSIGAIRRRPAWRARDGATSCPVCGARREAEREALARASRVLREPPPHERRSRPLCARHCLVLRKVDERAAVVAARAAAETADLLAAELAEEFERTTWARRAGAPVAEATAWRRAAAFLDGTVFGAWGK